MFNIPQEEEQILEFWKKHRVFEKTLEKTKNGKPFRFYEGPPTANGVPGIHHVLARVFKDIICRFKTMQGFFVLRKAGWDTHGLPVELEIEKKLKIRTKDEIIKYGIGKFNELAKESVWKYKTEWENLTDRIGFWLDLNNPYITYNAKYIETLWHIFKKISSKGLVYKGYKVVPYCPRCGTSLSSHEVSLGYKKVEDPSIYLKLRIKNSELSNKQNQYLLVWTTTPWTLPGNVAVAVNPKLEYSKFKIKGEYYWSFNPPPIDNDENILIEEKISGKKLIGLEYEPIFSIGAFQRKVVGGDFVSTEEGTGLVHIAPAFGEEDLEIGIKEKLPILNNVDFSGNFTFNQNELSKDEFLNKISKVFVKDADPIILNELKQRDVLFSGNLTGTMHDYPFCWRCSSPLLYYLKNSWFIRTTRVKKDLIENNKKIKWVPEYLKEGRFGEWLAEVKDWAISRERFWGTPLPIWQCRKCDKHKIIGSIKELKKYGVSRVNFILLRHGEAEHNVRQINSSEKNDDICLTPKGKKQLGKTARALKRLKINKIFSSDLKRTRETSEIISGLINFKGKIEFDKRLREIDTGEFNGKKTEEYYKFVGGRPGKFEIKPKNGETILDVKKRALEFLKDTTENGANQNKKILVIAHGDVLWALESLIAGQTTKEEMLRIKDVPLAGFRKLGYRDLPLNPSGELDLHRPFVDDIELKCSCGSKMKRIEEVMDVWFDSGAMPFAQWHWPFENKNLISRKINFPADYISEAIDQTRGWFYTLLAVSTLLGFKTPPYLSVISLGHILDEKGEKMSKSKGNIVNPWDIIKKHGVDALRWYFFTASGPAEPKLFKESDIAISSRRFILVLLNIYNFFETYIGERKLPNFQDNELTILEKWIIAKLTKVSSEITEHLENLDIVSAARNLENFVLEDFSRWYLRRNRELFQYYEDKDEFLKRAGVFFEVLKNTLILAAPFIPFTPDIIFQKIRVASPEKLAQSIHLLNWPKKAKLSPEEKTLMKEMDWAREISTSALALRKKHQIKVRQPLKDLFVKGPKINDGILEIIKVEINVKNIGYADKFNFESVKTNNFEVALDTKISTELLEEGIIREIIRQIQEMRAELKLAPKEKINAYLVVPQNLAETFGNNKELIAKKVWAKEVEFEDTEKFNAEKEIEINNEKIKVQIKI